MRLCQLIARPGLKWTGLVLTGLVCASCGGDGGPAPSNSYAGNYVGEFLDANGKVGAFSVTVYAQPQPGIGNVEGNYTSSSPAAIRGLLNFTGTIGANGAGKFTVGYPFSNSPGGTIAFAPPNKSTTSVSMNSSDLPGAVAGLVPSVFATTGSTGPSWGAYIGTITDTSLNATGGLALSVSSSRAATGVEVIDVHGTPTAIPISGTAVNNTPAVPPTNPVLDPAPAENGLQVESPLSIVYGQISGSVTLSNGDTATLSLSNTSEIFDLPSVAH